MEHFLYWSKEWKSWCLVFTDIHGNQVGDCECYPNSRALKLAWKQYTRENQS